jgi:2-polyprenyl-6-methoxyphenol hydroxylase-like FAD-dependent oxidoreductase
MNRDHAIVVGAGIAGLAASAALSRFFRKVTVFEKDSAESLADVRLGAVQGAHTHTMLRGGEAGLERLLPGIRDNFLAVGAVELDMGADYVGFDAGVRRAQRDLDMPVIMMSRPSYEAVLRTKVLELPNVSLTTAIKIESIDLSTAGSCIRINDNGKEIGVEADLVIDARGRGSPVLAELSKAGFGPVPEKTLGIKMCYVSGRFKQKAGHIGTRTAMLVRPEPPECRYGIVFPIEGGDWMITLGGRRDIVPPTDLEGFSAYARDLGVPDLFAFIEGAELVGKLARYRKQTAFWRAFDQMEGFPRGFIPVGDTITSINPTFGQGMTVSVLHALALNAALSEDTANMDEMLAHYWRGAMDASATAWSLAQSTDLQYDWVERERPENFEQAIAFSKGLKLLANQDLDVQRRVMEVFHVERLPSDLQSADIISGITRHLTGQA